MADANFTEFPITTRAEAKASGANRYFNAKPCPHGHVTQRYVSTGMCIECLRLASKRTARDPIKIAQGKARYAIKRAAELAARPPKELTAQQKARLSGEITFLGPDCPDTHGGRRYTSNGQCVACTIAKQTLPGTKERKRAWALKNKERLDIARAVKYAEEREIIIERARLWALENPEKRRTISLSYKARRRAVEVLGDSTALIHAWKISAKKVCYWCGDKCQNAFHIDHYEPLAKGGAHAVDNLVIACPQCNLTKNAKDPYLFAARSGRLF